MLLKEAIESLTYQEVLILAKALTEAIDGEQIKIEHRESGTVLRGLICSSAKDKKEIKRTFYFSKNGG
jgi:hypothetical protein